MRNRIFYGKALFLIFLSIIITTTSCAASEESPSIFNEFKIVSKGFGDSGPISVAGESDRGAVTKLEIDAFGNHYSLNEKQLKKLSGLMVNGIQISMDGGYGGRSFSIVLSTGYVANVVDKRYISVSKKGVDVYESID